MENEPKPEQKRVSVGVDDKAIAFRPRNFEELWGFAKIVCDTDFVPSQFKGKPGAVLAAVQYGFELGMEPMHALRSIAVINGVPTVHSAGYWSLIKSHPLCEWTKELAPDEALAKGYGECTIMRKGDPEPTTRRFSLEMAEKAGLVARSGEKGPWAMYRGRMLQQRARHLCGDDAIPEATGGLVPKEVADDYDYETTATQEQPIATPQAVREDTANGEYRDKSSERMATAGATSTAGNRPDIEPYSEVSPKDKILLWLESQATDEELISAKNYLSENLKGLSKAEQLEVCRVWNDKKRAALARREQANA